MLYKHKLCSTTNKKEFELLCFAIQLTVYNSQEQSEKSGRSNNDLPKLNTFNF